MSGGPGRARRQQKCSLEPGARGPQEHPFPSSPPPAPPNTLGLTPKPSSPSLLTRSPAPTDIRRRVCTPAHACTHTARAKARPLTDTSASPPRPGGKRCHHPASRQGGGDTGQLRGPPSHTGSPLLLCTGGVPQRPCSRGSSDRPVVPSSSPANCRPRCLPNFLSPNTHTHC